MDGVCGFRCKETNDLGERFRRDPLIKIGVWHIGPVAFGVDNARQYAIYVNARCFKSQSK